MHPAPTALISDFSSLSFLFISQVAINFVWINLKAQEVVEVCTLTSEVNGYVDKGSKLMSDDPKNQTFILVHELPQDLWVWVRAMLRGTISSTQPDFYGVFMYNNIQVVVGKS